MAEPSREPRSRRTPRTARARRLPAERRRQQLLDAAASVFLEEGPAALTMERLAERADVSKGLGYAYFRDAEDVALSLWDREVSEVYRRVEDATADARNFEQGLRAAVSAYFDVVAERGALLGALQAHFGGSKAERRIRRRVIDFLRFWSRQLQRAYALEPAVAITLAGMMVSAVEAGARSWSLGAVERGEAESLCMSFITEGFAAAPAAAARGSSYRRSAIRRGRVTS